MAIKLRCKVSTRVVTIHGPTKTNTATVASTLGTLRLQFATSNDQAAQQFHRVAEAHAASFHHPIDGATTDPAAEAVPQVLARRHDQAGRGVLVERAAPRHVLAAALEFDPRGLDQTLDLDLCLLTLDLGVGDACHRMSP
jgi:hypothetical protein